MKRENGLLNTSGGYDLNDVQNNNIINKNSIFERFTCIETG